LAFSEELNKSYGASGSGQSVVPGSITYELSSLHIVLVDTETQSGHTVQPLGTARAFSNAKKQWINLAAKFSTTELTAS